MLPRAGLWAYTRPSAEETRLAWAGATQSGSGCGAEPERGRRARPDVAGVSGKEPSAPLAFLRPRGRELPLEGPPQNRSVKLLSYGSPCSLVDVFNTVFLK